MSDEPQATCPECGQAAERILSGGAGFLFKGDGFYITDYRSESYKKEASKESSSDPVTEKADPAKKKETKTAAGPSGDQPKTSTKDG
jgi:predicted nucleic acid-binding Zn ribbon protein